ncbi:MAG: glycosyl transferase family 2 [Verrucomicrobiales bacterium]|nr:glycosyl transferase family 2 [Verrucomicrobiales bacterium]
MAAEFLSICIPTRNRSPLLSIALEQLAREIEANQLTPDKLRIYISDNCSTDETAKVVEKFKLRLPHIHYSCNATNIGADRNILSCPAKGSGQYCWIMGDDDHINTGSLAYIWDILEKNRPVLFINSDGRYETGFKLPALFPNYRALAEESMRVNPHMLIAHTLITANIFRRDCFDQQCAEEKLLTNYGHMYGLVSKLHEIAAPVYVTGRCTITARDSSEAGVDGIFPTNLVAMWIDYLTWLKPRFSLTTLEPKKISEYAAAAVRLQLKAHPIRSLLRVIKRLGSRKAYKQLWDLFTKSK